MFLVGAVTHLIEVASRCKPRYFVYFHSSFVNHQRLFPTSSRNLMHSSGDDRGQTATLSHE